MADLLLDSLEIRQFRAFQHLEIERLGRVNLIVGKNNVGKTCLLEALWLYAHKGSQSAIWKLLDARDESGRLSLRGDEVVREHPFAIRYLFHGRQPIRTIPEPVRIGPLGSADRMLSVGVGWYTPTDANGRRGWLPIQPAAYGTIPAAALCLVTQTGGQAEVIQQIDWYAEKGLELARSMWPTEQPTKETCTFLGANGLEERQMTEFWDAVALTDLENDVLTALRIIAPGVQRLNLVSSQQSRSDRIPMARIADLDTPVPLRSLGEGLNRLFGLALALVNVRGGCLLVDEIESGLHYSVQPDLWRLVFRLAHRLDVQVFATSHSWDCVASFQQAAQEDAHEQGQLIRLQKHGEAIDVTLFDEHELAIATREQIEVR